MTTVATGLGGAVGIAAETTYGTWVDPTTTLEVRSFKMQGQPHIVQGEGLAYGRALDLGTRRNLVYLDGKGTMDLEFLNQKQALLLAWAMGSNATLTQLGTTTAYQIVCDLGLPDLQNYLSMQALVRDTAGNIKQQNFHGCKSTSVTFTSDLTTPLMWSFDIDSQTFTDSETAFTPSYLTNTRNFTFNQLTVSAGAFGSEASVDGITKVSLKVERGMYTDRVYAGTSGVKSEPLSNAYIKLTGSIDLDLTANNKATLWDIMNTQAAVPSLVFDWVGNAIGSSGHHDELKLNATDVFIDSDGTPELDSPAQTHTTLNFTGLIDSANDSALIATLTTADSSM